MTAKPNSTSRATAQSGPMRRLPDFWKRIVSDSRDSAFASHDQKGGVSPSNTSDSGNSPKTQNLVIYEESGHPAYQQATIDELQNPGSSSFEMKVFQSARRDPSSTIATEPVFVTVMQERDKAWLAFPITKFSHSGLPDLKISTNSTITTETSNSLERNGARRTANENREPSFAVMPHFSSIVPRDLWRPLLPSIAFIPAESPLRNLHAKELVDLEEALAQSKLIISEEILWHAIPSTTWTTAALPLLEPQQPPVAVRRDWARQCRDVASRIARSKIHDDQSSDGTNASNTTPSTQKAEWRVDASPLDPTLDPQTDSLLSSLPDSPCHYLLSVHGLIFPIRALQEHLIRSLAIQPEEPQIDWLLDWGEQPVVIDWPEIPSPTESLPTNEPSKTTSQTSLPRTSSIAPANTFTIQPRSPKPATKKKHRQHKLFAVAFAGTATAVTLLLCSRLLTASPKTTATAPAKGNDILASSGRVEPASNPNHPSESNELTDTAIPADPAEVDLAKITTTPALATSDALVPLSPDQIVMQSLANSGISKRPSSANQGLTAPTSETPIVDPLAMGSEAMGVELVGDVEPASVLEADAPNLIAPEGAAGVAPKAVDGDLVLEPTPGEPLFIIPVAKAFQRVELKTNPQSEKNETDNFSKNRPCWAQLKLSDEAISEVAVQPEEFEIALSDAPAKWRLTIDEVVPELHIYMLTKPGRRWYFMVQVGVCFPGDIHPTPLGRDDAANVLFKLQTHQQWLTQSIDVLRNSPLPKRVPGRPDVFTQIRDLQSQQKATNKAIEQWTEVARLCHELFSYGSIAITLDEPQPSIPNEDLP